MLGFVVSVLAVVCRQMQHLLPTMLGPAVHVVRRIQPIHVRLWRPCVMCVIGPNNVGSATVLCFGNHVWNERNDWELLAQKFNCFQTLHNNSQQHATTTYNIMQKGAQTDATCIKTCNIQQLMLCPLQLFMVNLQSSWGPFFLGWFDKSFWSFCWLKLIFHHCCFYLQLLLTSTPQNVAQKFLVIFALFVIHFSLQSWTYRC